MSRYPILVAQYDERHPCDLAICEGCKKTRKWDPDDGDPCDMCIQCKDCGGDIVFKYVEADKCRGCGKLGFWSKVLCYCCSRPCMLQAEYAKTLASSARTEAKP